MVEAEVLLFTLRFPLESMDWLIDKQPFTAVVRECLNISGERWGSADNVHGVKNGSFNFFAFSQKSLE